jgi:hypothetical protein
MDGFGEFVFFGLGEHRERKQQHGQKSHTRTHGHEILTPITTHGEGCQFHTAAFAPEVGMSNHLGNQTGGAFTAEVLHMY